MPVAMPGEVSLRPATLDDLELVFTWRNLPQIVANSSLQTTVTLDEHRAWFTASLQRTDRTIDLILIDGQPLGLCRFDREGDEAVISIYLVEAQGKGHGITAIRQACQTQLNRWPDLTGIRADVRADNAPGQRAFLKACFVSTSAALADHLSYRLTY